MKSVLNMQRFQKFTIANIGMAKRICLAELTNLQL